MRLKLLKILLLSKEFKTGFLRKSELSTKIIKN